MMFIFLQTIKSGVKRAVPYRISVMNDHDLEFKSFTFYPQKIISKNIYNLNNLKRSHIINTPPFCDYADELIDIFSGQQLIFNDSIQFKQLKSLFKVIGYNFYAKPKFIRNGFNKKQSDFFDANIPRDEKNSLASAEIILKEMIAYSNGRIEIEKYDREIGSSVNRRDWSKYESKPGVYFFFNQINDVVYIGKAKNVRKRLQSHFSGNRKVNRINYSEVNSIEVIYTGNDFIAQLIETTEIKKSKPKFNSQQIEDSAPFIINIGTTAKGVNKLMIVRKEYIDNLPEKYYNRNSVKVALKKFCLENDLCRKYCGIETIKGPCSKVTDLKRDCVCNRNESVANYNIRFDIALKEFRQRKSRKIYKLQGRNISEDAFVYTINGIYQGYGFIDKKEHLGNANDILGFLVSQYNTYESSRVIDAIRSTIDREKILNLEL